MLQHVLILNGGLKNENYGASELNAYSLQLDNTLNAIIFIRFIEVLMRFVCVCVIEYCRNGRFALEFFSCSLQVVWLRLERKTSTICAMAIHF